MASPSATASSKRLKLDAHKAGRRHVRVASNASGEDDQDSGDFGLFADNTSKKDLSDA